jgi:nicotinamidase/pyrazinamidase
MVTYTPTSALVVVDVQNDFADPDGGLYVRRGDEVVPSCNSEIVKALSAGAFVVYTQDWHPESTPHFEKDGGVWPVHCVADTWGAEFHPALLLAGPVVRKGSNGEDGYSGFTMRDPRTDETKPTELAGLLAERAITDVVVVGLAYDVCVKATALDAVGLRYGTSIIEQATAAVELAEGDAERASKQLGAAGVAVI